MALRGNLRDFSVTQLLNLINLAKKNGTLIVEGPNDKAHIAFRDGKLAFAQIGQEDNRLATVLYKANKLSQGQYRAIMTRAAQVTDKELGLLLINAGYITQEDILVNLQVYFTDVIRRLFTWVEGFFRFENDMMPPEDRINVRLDLEIRRIVYGLIQAGLVELMRPEGALAPARETSRPAPPVNVEEQKSLVNRLITRIRTM